MSTTYSNIRNYRHHSGVNQHGIETIDMHTGGEPLRVILDGFPELKGEFVLDYRRYCLENYDHYRQLLMFEPRGHADMYGCIMTPPNDENADYGACCETNPDGSVECIASCGTAPVMAMNEDFHESVTLEGADKIVEACE